MSVATSQIFDSGVMDRIPEPELMDDPAQARAYAQADFSQPHQAFVDRFSAWLPGHRPQRVLDLGCGPADVTLRFARAHPACRVVGVDGAQAMLDLGREAVARVGLGHRVELVRACLPSHDLEHDGFDTVISNSLLHHLADPSVLWHAVKACARAPAAVFVMDLMRPDSLGVAQALTDRYAEGEPEVLRRDFLHSLCAAYRPEEVKQQLRRAGLAGLRVEAVSDRHLLVWGHLV